MGSNRARDTFEAGQIAKLYIGLSGFFYKEWQGEGLFYPKGLKSSEWFMHYAARYNALEADGTWYQMPSEAGVEKWIKQTRDDFRVSPKMHRRVTHMARLKPEGMDSLKFFLKRLEPLEKAGKLGSVLVQLPPNLKRNDDRLAAFLSDIPRRPSLPWCLEFRNDTWHTPEVEETLRSYNVSWCAADTDEADAQRRDTADHIYARLRKTAYSDELLANWAAYIREKIQSGKDCYVFCKHEDAEQPWVWADKLTRMVNQ